jgi:predicted  nucleic acid-binding Zn-ribbon protein
MEGYCSTGQSPQRAVAPTEEEEEEEEDMATIVSLKNAHYSLRFQALYVTEDQIVP